MKKVVGLILLGLFVGTLGVFAEPKSERLKKEAEARQRTEQQQKANREAKQKAEAEAKRKKDAEAAQRNAAAAAAAQAERDRSYIITNPDGTTTTVTPPKY